MDFSRTHLIAGLCAYGDILYQFKAQFPCQFGYVCIVFQPADKLVHIRLVFGYDRQFVFKLVDFAF